MAVSGFPLGSAPGGSHWQAVLCAWCPAKPHTPPSLPHGTWPKRPAAPPPCDPAGPAAPPPAAAAPPSAPAAPSSRRPAAASASPAPGGPSPPSAGGLGAGGDHMQGLHSHSSHGDPHSYPYLPGVRLSSALFSLPFLPSFPVSGIPSDLEPDPSLYPPHPLSKDSPCSCSLSLSPVCT